MEAMLIYFGKMMLCSAVLFCYYHLALRNRTFHHYNRFYLLGIVAVSLLLPLLKLSYFTLEVNKNIYLLLNNIQNFNSTKTLNDDNLYFTVAAIVFGLVSFLLVTKLIFGIFKIESLKKDFPKEYFEDISFYQTNLENAPFSYFRNLFWKNSILINSDLGRQILKHEMVHIEQKHSFDKIFMELVTGIFWFNPVFWFIKKEINLIHEYLADKKAVTKSDTKAFAQMLLASHFSGKVLPATSPFLSSNLKKRLKMLQKPKTKFGYAHRILALPLVFTLAFVYAVNAKNKEIAKSNKAIEMAVAEIKKDTLKPKTIDDKIRIQSDSARFYSDQLRKEDEKIKSLNGKIAEKSKEVKSLAKNKADSPEHLKAENDLSALMNEQSKIWDSPEYQEKWKKMETHFEKMDALFNSPEYQQKWKDMEQKGKEMEKMFNSKAFKEKIRQAEKNAKKNQRYFNSKKFKDIEFNAQKLAEEAKKNAEKTAAYINSPEFKKQIEDAKIAAFDAQLIAKNAQKVALDAVKDPSVKFIGKDRNYIIIQPNEAKKPRIFIDGEEYKGELKDFDNNKIESVNVVKDEQNGKIFIKTKK